MWVLLELRVGWRGGVGGYWGWVGEWAGVLSEGV